MLLLAIFKAVRVACMSAGAQHLFSVAQESEPAAAAEAQDPDVEHGEEAAAGSRQ